MNFLNRPSFKTGISKQYANLYEAYKEEGKYIKALRSSLKSITIAPKNKKKETFVRIFSILFPFSFKIYRLIKKSTSVIKNEGIKSLFIKVKCCLFRKSISEDKTK